MAVFDWKAAAEAYQQKFTNPDISLRAANEAVWQLHQKAEPAPHPCSLRDVMRPAFKPGSRFVREYRGKTHVVEVAQDGCFAWNAQRFKSLSHAARAITGYNVSGFKFFGVKP